MQELWVELSLKMILNETMSLVINTLLSSFLGKCQHHQNNVKRRHSYVKGDKSREEGKLWTM
jgi:hypothetical protein